MKRIYLIARGNVNPSGGPILRILESEAVKYRVYGEDKLVRDTLYAVLEGPEESVDHLMKFIPMASPAVRIQEISIREKECRGDY
jgi:acylphosphatase